MGSTNNKTIVVPIIQALAPYLLGRLLCSQRACPSYTLDGYWRCTKVQSAGLLLKMILLHNRYIKDGKKKFKRCQIRK